MSRTGSITRNAPLGSIVAIALAFALGIACGLCGCLPTGAQSSDSVQDAAEVAVESSQASEVAPAPAFTLPELVAYADGAVPDFERLAALMGKDEAAKLFLKARTDPDLFWIAAHPETLAACGETVQGKLLRLAADEDAAVGYVRHFGERYLDMEEGESDGIELPEGAGPYPAVAIGNANVPHLFQWDPAWGYAEYSSAPFGMSACGPTAFAMAYQGVTGDGSFSPYDAGVLSWALGYMDEFEGTYAGYLYGASQSFGLLCEALPSDATAVRDALGRGCVIVANVGHGYFSRFSGHYLVITGLDAQGNAVVNDPYSVVNSLKTWDIAFILGETKQLFAISLA